jgi:Mn2+/Fe2+ NRAMP family transporter
MSKFVQFGKSVKSVLFWSVISAAFIGPGTVTTCAISGATYGLGLLWTLTFATFTCIILQETVARITIASGYNLGEVIAIRYADKKIKYVLAIAIIFGCAAYQAGNILGAVAGLRLVFNADNELLTIFVVGIASLVLSLGTDKSVSRFMGLLVALMGLMFILVSTQSDFSFFSIFISSVTPSLPIDSGLLIISMIGTTIVPYNLFLGSGIGKGQEIGEMRLGIVVAILIGGLISMAILVSGTLVKGEFSYTIMSIALHQKLGSWAELFFVIGLFSAGFTSAITAPLAANITILSIVQDNNPYRKYYKFTWALVMFVGFIFGISGVKPIPMIILAQALNGLLLPIITIFVVLIINDNAFIQPPYRNSIFANLILLVVVGLTTFLGLNNLEKATRTVLSLPFSSELTLWAIAGLSVLVVGVLGIFMSKK